MWGQPPSAVRASEARRGFLLQLSQSEPGRNFISPSIRSRPGIPTKLQEAELRSADSRGRLSPHKTKMLHAFYRRQLPHLQCDDKQHFITFCTNHRWVLPAVARSIVLECCLHDNGFKFDLRAAIVMPDHVHMIFTPLVNEQAAEVYSLGEIMDAVKGASAHKVNKAIGRRGRLWQPESFDHVLRSSENLDAKIIYVLENPVRLRLVNDWTDYPWIWRKPFVSPFAPALEL
jgi:REP-associated tyrosine transposase